MLKNWSALVILMILLYSCSALRQLKNTLIPIEHTFYKTDSILGKAQGKKIQDITKTAAQGFVSGINLDSIKIDNFLDSLLANLGSILSTELNEIEFDSLTNNLSDRLNVLIQDPQLKSSILKLLDTLRSNIQTKPINIKINPVINDQVLIALIDSLKNRLLNDNTALTLGSLLDKTLLNLSEGSGLDSILQKVNATVTHINDKLNDQNDNLNATISKLWWSLISVGILVLIIIGYAYRKYIQREKYKNLALTLTKGIDKIKDQSDYDNIVQSVRKEANQNKVDTLLEELVSENDNSYTVKQEFKNKENQALKAVKLILADETALQDKLIKNTQHDIELNKFIKDKLLNK